MTIPVDISRERIEHLRKIGCADYLHMALLEAKEAAEAAEVRADAALRFREATYNLAGPRPTIRDHEEPEWNVDLFEVERAALDQPKEGKDDER